MASRKTDCEANDGLRARDRASSRRVLPAWRAAAAWTSCSKRGRTRARCETDRPKPFEAARIKPGAGFPGNTREADGRARVSHRSKRGSTTRNDGLRRRWSHCRKVIGGMGGESEAIQIRSTERGRWNEAERAPAAHYDMSDGWGGRKGDYGFICLVKRHRSTTTATSHVTSLAGFVACLINLVII